MAKARQDPKHDGKPDSKPTQKVSTSRIFKNAKKQASTKPKGKIASRQPLQEIRVRNKRKRKPTPEHSLSADYSEVVEISRNQIQEDSAQSVKAAVDDLSNRLRASKNDLAKQCRADNETDETLIKPLGDEELRYARPDGSQVGSAPLSTRFKKFQNTIVEEEEKLKSLFEQLAQVNEEIAEDAEAALGPDWAKVVGCAPFGKSRDVVHEDGKETDKEMQEIQTHFEELIGNVSEKHLEEMKASEKAFKVRQKKDKKTIMALMGDDED